MKYIFFISLSCIVLSCNTKKQTEKDRYLEVKEEIILSFKEELEKTNFNNLEKEIMIVYMRESLRFLNVYKDREKSLELAYELNKFRECKNAIFSLAYRHLEEDYITEQKKITKLNKNFQNENNRKKIFKIRKKNSQLFSDYHYLSRRGYKAIKMMTPLLTQNKKVVRQYDQYLSYLSGHSFGIKMYE